MNADLKGLLYDMKSELLLLTVYNVRGRKAKNRMLPDILDMFRNMMIYIVFS